MQDGQQGHTTPKCQATSLAVLPEAADRHSDKEEVNLSQTSHRLTGQDRTRVASLDLRRTLACGYGLRGSGWISGTDLRI